MNGLISFPNWRSLAVYQTKCKWTNILHLWHGKRKGLKCMEKSNRNGYIYSLWYSQDSTLPQCNIRFEVMKIHFFFSFFLPETVGSNYVHYWSGKKVEKLIHAKSVEESSGAVTIKLRKGLSLLSAKLRRGMVPPSSPDAARSGGGVKLTSPAGSPGSHP